jgi:hypothetical protein
VAVATGLERHRCVTPVSSTRLRRLPGRSRTVPGTSGEAPCLPVCCLVMASLHPRPCPPPGMRSSSPERPQRQRAGSSGERRPLPAQPARRRSPRRPSPCCGPAARVDGPYDRCCPRRRAAADALRHVEAAGREARPATEAPSHHRFGPPPSTAACRLAATEDSPQRGDRAVRLARGPEGCRRPRTRGERCGT